MGVQGSVPQTPPGNSLFQQSQQDGPAPRTRAQDLLQLGPLGRAHWPALGRVPFHMQTPAQLAAACPIPRPFPKSRGAPFSRTDYGV